MDRAAVNKHENQTTFTDILRSRFKGVANTCAGFLLKIGLTPNVVTLLGMFGHLVAAILVINRHIIWGGVVLLVMAPMDFLDGSMARMRGQTGVFGAFLDSVTDRYSEFILLGGILVYNLMNQDWIACLGVYLAAMGSIMVSYTRARAEGLGISVKVGLLTRVERYIILIPGLLFNIPNIAAWIIAVLSHFTALQRILYVRREAYNTSSGKTQD